jgi:curli biogenesis system outer membrane secretion channel CsgG
VIIDEFDYSAVMTSVQAVFGTQQNIGKGIRAMLVKRVAEQGKLVVVERAKINSLQAEQDRNASNRVQAGERRAYRAHHRRQRAAGRRHHHLRP